MDNLADRLATLSSEQRELLELRLKRKGIEMPLAVGNSAQSAVGATIDRPSRHKDYLQPRLPENDRGISFSLYFFSADGSKLGTDKYRLILESAKFADQNGFSAVWTPERHFQDFGGLYPNPSVLSAALAMVTQRIQIRAGSVALPLHHPIRVAEEWSIVDNLSRGRIAVSFASGWHPNDFVFAPDCYDDRKAVMYDYVDMVRRLWRGEAVHFSGIGPEKIPLKILPRPVQPDLPVWITTAGSTETWRKAGEIGANILCALIGYAPDELAARIKLYREALSSHGHPQNGQVTIMVHTFLGTDEATVKEQVRAPMYKYLRTFLRQLEHVRVDPDSMTEEDANTILSMAFERYFDDSALMGTPQKCAALVNRLVAAGVDEIACLIDFGVEPEEVLESLHYLAQLQKHFQIKTEVKLNI